MKTLKAIAIFTLVASLSLVPMKSAWAHHRHRHHSHGGTIAAAAIGGTALGLVLGTVASQPKQAPQSQVVVVQPKSNDTGYSKQQYQALQLERERARRIALEREIMRLKASSND